MSELAINGGAPVVPGGMIQPWPHITAEDKRAVMEALDRASPWRHPCEDGTALEKEWAAFVGVRHALACNSGTAALHMGVAACEIGPGDEVLVPADTYLGSASCVMHSNGIPIFVDVRPETDTLDPARIEERITDRTRAIVAVNLHGLPADYDQIHAVAAKHGLLIIEDGAQSHGATYKGRQAGSLGHVSGCSINGSKPLSALGEGGLFTTDDERRCALAQHLRMFGEIVDPATPHDYDAFMMGWNYRADPLQAAFARSQLRRLPEMTAVRLRNGAHLTRRLAEIPGVEPPHVPPDRTHTYFQYTMQLRPEEIGLDATALGAFHTTLCRLMRAEGVPLRAWQRHPLPAQAIFQQQVGYGKGCPWSCTHTRPGIRYDPAEYPVAADICRRRVMLGHSTDSFGPPNTIELMDLYAEAFHKVIVEHRAELIALVREAA